MGRRPDRRLADPRDRRGKLASPRPTAPHRGRLGSRAATLNAITVVGIAATGLLTCVSFGTLAVRLRRSAPDVQRQIAWAAYGGAVAVAIALPGTVFDLSGPVTGFQAGALMAAGSRSTAYRLYDIEFEMLNRTLVYGALTGLLAGAYLACVLLLQLILSPSSNLSIAASTLAVAAFGAACPSAHPSTRRPPLLPQQVRRTTNPRGVHLAPARPGIARRTRRRPACRRRRDNAASARLTVATPAMSAELRVYGGRLRLR